MFHALVLETVTIGFAVYPLISLGLALEGDFLLFAVMLGVFEQVFNPTYAVIAVLIGAFLGDGAWYHLGRVLARNPSGRIARAITRITEPFDARLRAQPVRMLFLSKLTYGLHRPILIRFGMLGLSQRRLFTADIPAVLLWFLAITGLAWIAHETLLPVATYLRYFEVALLVIFIGFVGLQFLVSFAAGGFLGLRKRVLDWERRSTKHR